MYLPIKIEAEGWYIITIILLGSLIIHILLFIRKKGGFTSNFGTIMNHPFVYSVHSAVIFFTWKLLFGSSALSILFAHEITISNDLSLVLFLVVSFCETAKFLFQEVGSEKISSLIYMSFKYEIKDFFEFLRCPNPHNNLLSRWWFRRRCYVNKDYAHKARDHGQKFKVVFNFSILTDVIISTWAFNWSLSPRKGGVIFM